MAKKRALGRGLGALIPERGDAKKENNYSESTDKKINKKEENKTKTNKKTNSKDKIVDDVLSIKIDQIKVNEDNARKTFNQESIDSLGESIKLYGVLQPLVLIKREDHYEIVAGERRFRAAKSVGLKEVPAIIKDLSKKDKDMVSMVENIQREDLNPYEEAQAYNNIMKDYKMTQAELSELLGKSRTYIANIVRLLKLDDFTIKELENGNITSSQARALLSIDDILLRKDYLDKLARKEITVNEIEKKASRKKKNVSRDIFVVDIEERLTESLGTKVKVNKGKNKWTVNIEFSSDDQLEDFLSQYEEEV
ncbi:ParB/RepB/Spo0J family partition protein [Helcococcus massiliensis]|uniref:ParB/RepB/Spo0J family partition protein n=1 Tax=Helcococcus massiliensis TaxID=2040290 RepID=UPI000CDF04AC|nr:ParB/RepB/Spo0J family partition protein [Helcococcus massiliensis]